jgi:hypothetical protein
MFYSRIALLTFLCGIGACASAPEYAPAANADDYGHYSSKLEENRYRIVFNGRPSAGPNTTRDYALLHAAELTLREGYDWFEIVDRETTTTTHGRQPASAVSYERTYYVEHSCGLLSCTRSVRPWTSAGARMDFDSGRSRTTYSHVLEIVMGKGKIPEEGGRYYEAAPVATSLVASM